MRIKLKSLEFTLPDEPFGENIRKMKILSQELEELGEKAGTGNQKFNEAYERVQETIKYGGDLLSTLYAPIMVRALAVSLLSSRQSKIGITQDVLLRIDELRPKPSTLLIQNMYQYYLSHYDQLSDRVMIGLWLRTAMTKNGMLQEYHLHLLAENGPKWMAKQAIANNREFSNQLKHFDLENYASGNFLTVAKNIYFVEQLKTIPANEPHELLQEVQSPQAYNSRYDEHFLLGHKVLEIIINRAPASNVDDSWLNVVMAIAGDPRVPTAHAKHRKWWSQLKPALKQKVMGWLSKLDLRLFLEALENYSVHSGKKNLQRMFPSRKYFLEGLENKDLITHTRLYLSSGADKYLRENYKPEHLPQYSLIKGGEISVIHVQIGDIHMIEGSHSCYLWIYPRLDDSAIVFKYEKKDVLYENLTAGLSRDMRRKGIELTDQIQHKRKRFFWQHKALQSLNDIGVNISPEDVLSEEDYYKYKRIYGVGYGA